MSNKQFSIDMSNCGGFIDPQIQLGTALSRCDIRDFRTALDMGAEPTLPDAHHVTVFEKALQTHGCAEFVEACLRLGGCSPNFVSSHLNKAAINFAADSRDPRIIDALLQYSGVLVDRKYVQLTPLNALAKNITAENVNDVAGCIKRLLRYGASPNIPDQREMTPLHYVLKNRKIEAVKKRELVLYFLAQPNIDIDTYRDGEVRNLLNEEYATLQLPPVKTQGTEVTFESLLFHLRNSDEEKFLQQFAEYRLNISEKENLKNTSQEQNIALLFETIKHGLHNALAEVLDTKLNINAVHNGSTAVQVAAIWGNSHALGQLLAYHGFTLRPEDQLLITVIKKLDEPPLYSFCDYKTCFYKLLNFEQVDVNEVDASGSSPLHYAVKYRNRMAMQELLQRGAYIGTKSAFGDLPIQGMSPNVLEEHLNTCISDNGLKQGDENFELQLSYKNLLPLDRDVAPERCLHEEMTPIAFIAASREHRHLLQHPLITSFLFLKWHRLSVVFYLNFILYTFYAVSIVTHTVLKFRESEHETVTAMFGLFAWIGIAFLVLRELIQVAMSTSLYFRSPVNLMELALIVLSVMTCSEPSYDRETQRVIAVFTILLVAIELCLLVGSLPVLSISTHMLMLREVSSSFLKSFALYSIFVITFSLCFYILFGKEQLDANGEPNSDGEFNKFTNPFAAIIKTIVMLTGEFDAGDIEFDSLYSYLVFLLFVFFMSIVLFNLLNGLAVSDTQAIKAQAEINGSIVRTELLARYEHLLLGRNKRVSFIVSHEPFRSICRRLINIHPNYLYGRHISILPNDGNKVMLDVANSFELKDLSEARHSNKATFLPLSPNDHERQKKALDPPMGFMSCCFACVRGKCAEMDKRTVKLALAVVEQRDTVKKEKQQLLSTEKRLKSIEDKLELIFEFLKSK